MRGAGALPLGVLCLAWPGSPCPSLLFSLILSLQNSPGGLIVTLAHPICVWEASAAHPCLEAGEAEVHPGRQAGRQREQTPQKERASCPAAVLPFLTGRVWGTQMPGCLYSSSCATGGGRPKQAAPSSWLHSCCSDYISNKKFLPCRWALVFLFR